MPVISLIAYAKINLSLKILGLRGDGFHDIESVMQNVSLCDELELAEIKEGIEIVCDDPEVPVDKMNICYKAAEGVLMGMGGGGGMGRGIGRGIRIRIGKKIPMGAGLGGGSSDAAAVIVGLNKLWGLKMTQQEMIDIAAKAGSDVPFFIVGGRCLCRGRGEIVEKGLGTREQGLGEKRYYIIVKPDVSISTKCAFEEWDNYVDKQLTASGPQSLVPSPQNDLEKVIVPGYPIIAQIKEELLMAGCSLAQMTGSGSAVYGAVENRGVGDRVIGEMKKKYDKAYLVSEVDRGVEIL